MRNNKVAMEALIEGLDDWVAIDSVLATAYREVEAGVGDLREIVMGTLESLLVEGEMKAGTIGDSGFEDWEDSVSQNLARIQLEMDEFDWWPFGGSACWLRNTEKGDVVARALIGD